MKFNPLNEYRNGNHVFTRIREFSPEKYPFRPETIDLVSGFAYAMSFGGKGCHRDHRSGGNSHRNSGQIFSDTFQGKLAECAVANLFHRANIFPTVDFSTSGMGIWDEADFFVMGKKLSVKSTKGKGNLLLLETHDWNSEGLYIPNEISRGPGKGWYDFHVLVRIEPFPNRNVNVADPLSYVAGMNECNDPDRIKKLFLSYDWHYDFAGFITGEELKQVIADPRMVIHKGQLLGNVPMDADNYYIQAGDMHRTDELLSLFIAENGFMV